MATARLRKVFRYPDDNEHEPSELDEEEQEKLIADLQQHDATNSQIYTIVFSFIPIGGALYFLSIVYNARSFMKSLAALLSALSLAATAYVLLMLPLGSQDKKGKKPVYVAQQEVSLVNRAAIYLIAACSGLLGASAIVSWWKGSHQHAVQEALPLGRSPLYTPTTLLISPVIFAFTMYVREQLRPLAWQELRQARYELKGA